MLTMRSGVPSCHPPVHAGGDGRSDGFPSGAPPASHCWMRASSRSLSRRSPFFTVLLGDSRAYDQWAQRIAGGDWIGREVFYQAPLYPYFLAVLYAIAGRHLLLVRTVQAIIGSAACVLLGLAARRLIS